MAKAKNALRSMVKPGAIKMPKPMKAKTTHHGKNLGAYLHPKKASRRG